MRALLFSVLAPSLALAQAERPYAGVSTTFPDPVKGGPAARPGEVRWLGFEPGDDSSRLFIQLTAPVDPQLSRSGDSVTVRFAGLRLSARNMRRPLVPRFFATPVRMVRAKQERGDVVVRIALKQALEPKLTTREQGSYHVVILEFPPGQADADGKPKAPARPPPPK
jgi:AMIN domain-containing protein